MSAPSFVRPFQKCIDGQLHYDLNNMQALKHGTHTFHQTCIEHLPNSILSYELEI
jgi:hypothetical protein